MYVLLNFADKSLLGIPVEYLIVNAILEIKGFGWCFAASAFCGFTALSREFIYLFI